VGDRRNRLRFFERWVFNPPMLLLLHIGLAPRAFALLETTGRRTGKRRRTPVGNGLAGDVFWLVAETADGGYVRNLRAQPRVRVKVGGRWHSGTASFVEDDDCLARRSRIDSGNGVIGRLDGMVFRASARIAGNTPVTVRIQLEAG